MTIRSHLSRLKRRAFAVILVGFALFACSGLLGRRPATEALMLVAFGLFLLATLYMTVMIRCPNCRSRWGQLMSDGTALSIDHRLQVCPYCRVDLDAPAPSTEPGVRAA